MSDFEQHPIGTATTLERMHDALDHIRRVCGNSIRMSKRVYWIQARAGSALDGDDKWKEYDYPRNRVAQQENLREKNRKLKTLLQAAECPDSDCDEGIVHRGGEFHQCQWCAEKKEVLE